MGSSVTASLCVRPSIFGQYSSRLGFAVLRESATSRPSARDRVASTSASSLLTIMPSGSVMRMGGISSPHSRRLYVRSEKIKKIGPLLRILGASDFARLHIHYGISAISEQPELRDLSRGQLFTHHRFYGISPERNH